MPFRFREDVFWCSCGERVIFLDLQRDRYFCLPSAANRAFARLTSGSAADEDRQALRSLIDSGLLREDDLPGDFSPRTPCLEPTADFLAPGARVVSLIATARSAAFEAAAAWRLRRRPLLEVMKWVDWNGARALGRRRRGDAVLEEIVACFARPTFFVPAAGRCLMRAIAAHTACCAEGIRPRLMLGVGMNPFRAHAWVQLEDKVLVGDFEQVRLFTPIAAFG